jgi:hypothetical protein
VVEPSGSAAVAAEALSRLRVEVERLTSPR